MERGREDADEGQDRDGHQREQQRPAGIELATRDPHRAPSRRQALDGQDDEQDEDHEDDRERGCEADLPLEEGQDVDLDPGTAVALPGPPPVET